jgi:hypothetical protein
VKRVVPVVVKFLRSFAKDLFHTFTKLQFSFGPRGIPIGEPLLAEIIDGREHFMQSCSSVGDILGGDLFG